MARLLYQTKLTSIPSGHWLAVKAAATALALFNVSGQIFALDNACARCAAELTSGTVRLPEITCAGCGWRYDVTTGEVIGLPQMRLDSYRVIVSKGVVRVENQFRA